MAPVVQIDNKFNLSLKSVKDALKIQPNDTFFIERENTHTITLKKTTETDPFIEAVKKPAIYTIKKRSTLSNGKMNCDQHESDGRFKYPYLFKYCRNAGISTGPG